MTFDCQYKVTGHLGKGGFGDVWKAQDNFTGDTLALKTVCIHYSQIMIIEFEED